MPSKVVFRSRCAFGVGFEAVATPPPDFSWKITADPEWRQSTARTAPEWMLTGYKHDEGSTHEGSTRFDFTRQEVKAMKALIEQKAYIRRLWAAATACLREV
jgi:hypothetical protein